MSAGRGIAIHNSVNTVLRFRSTGNTRLHVHREAVEARQRVVHELLIVPLVLAVLDHLPDLWLMSGIADTATYQGGRRNLLRVQQ